MSEVLDIHVVSYALGDPAGDNKQLYLLRAPSAAKGGGLTIMGAEVVQAGTVTNSFGVGGTTFTLALHKYTNATTPAVYGTVAAAIGGTTTGWSAGKVVEFTIDQAGTLRYISAGEWLVAQYNEVNAGNPVNASLIVRYCIGKGG